MKLIMFPIFVLTIASIINGATSNLNTQSFSLGGLISLFSGNAVLDVLVLLALAVVLATIAGINAFGTGLTAGVPRLLVITIVLLGVWGILSTTGGSLITNMPFGSVLYVGLTVTYLVGVIQLVSGGAGGAGEA